MLYNFDEIIDRAGSNSVNVEEFRRALFRDRERKLVFPYPDEEMIRMWVADMDFGVADEIIKAVKQRLDRRIFGYTRIFDSAYYDVFSHWTKTRYDWSFGREELVTANGVVPTLYELADAICAPDDKVLILTPSYGPFQRAVQLQGRECLCSDLINDSGRYTMDFDDLAAKLDDPKVSLCIFCNPHNPTGRLWTREELLRFGALCADRGTWVISDEIHCDLLRSGKRHIPLAKLFPGYVKIITCMAPSKTFNMAGLLFSNVIIPDRHMRKIWLSRHHNSDNPLSIAAAQAAYEYGGDWLSQLLRYLDGNFEIVRRRLSERLPKAVFQIPESTYLAWIDLSAYFDPEEDLTLFFAMQAGVLIEGGKMFVRQGDGFIRLNLACPHAVVEEAMSRVCTAVREKKGS